MRALVCLSSLLLLASGCSERPPAPTAPFVAGNAEDAIQRVRSFLDAYVAADVEGALSHLCERDPQTRLFVERSLAPGSPFRIASYEIADAAPIWERKQPLYLVLVKLPRRRGPPIEHGYRVRVEDGCIERLFGAAPEAAPPSHPRASPPPSHPSLPPSHPSLPPSHPGPQPSLPVAPTGPDDEIIEL